VFLGPDFEWQLIAQKPRFRKEEAEYGGDVLDKSAGLTKQAVGEHTHIISLNQYQCLDASKISISEAGQKGEASFANDLGKFNTCTFHRGNTIKGKKRGGLSTMDRKYLQLSKKSYQLVQDELVGVEYGANHWKHSIGTRMRFVRRGLGFDIEPFDARYP
jgi:hypothetical protein